MQFVDVLISVVSIALVGEPKACEFADIWPWEVPDIADKEWVDDEVVA